MTLANFEKVLAVNLRGVFLGMCYVIPAMKRLGATDDIAALAVFLASRDSSFLTGTSIPEDGGYVTL